MQPSSLIFVVTIAIWAFYLLQHWVRRREYLATAHSVDRFSEAIRVLEMHKGTPSTVGPQADSHDQPRSPLVARSSASSAATVASSSGASRGSASVSASMPARPRPVRTQPARTMLGALVGVGFLVALVALPVALALAALGRLTWLGVLIDVVVLVGLTVALRRAAVRRRAGRRAGVAQRSGPRERVGLLGRNGLLGLLGRARRHTGGSSSVSGRTGASLGDHSATAVAAQVAPAAAVDGAPVEAESAVVDPHAWTPVPVPPPTYTLKAKATYREPEPTGVAAREPDAAEQPAAASDEQAG